MEILIIFVLDVFINRNTNAMTKKILLLLNLLLTAGSVFAQTYYYERIAIVVDGVRTTASGDGHFITFTTKGCYDSDKNGYTENTGFREYKRTENNIRNYYGDSYFGKAYYYFSADYSRLNIKEENSGKIYVYLKKTAPADFVVSSRKKSTSTPIVAPIVPPISNNSLDFSADGSTVNSPVSQRRTCPSCHGTGKGWDEISYAPNYTGENNNQYCAECGKYMSAHRHIHHKCTVCNGKGYIN